MKLVKVKKSGQLRVDMDPEELGYFYALNYNTGGHGAHHIYPDIAKQMSGNETEMHAWAHNVFDERLNTVLTEGGHGDIVETIQEIDSEFQMRKRDGSYQ